MMFLIELSLGDRMIDFQFDTLTLIIHTTSHFEPNKDNMLFGQTSQIFRVRYLAWDVGLINISLTLT